MLDRIADGRTDLGLEFLAAGGDRAFPGLKWRLVGKLACSADAILRRLC